mgnify:CR=1 FL=1
MSVDLGAAIAFVTEHGTVLEKARLLRLLMSVEPGREAYQKLLDSQNADGGFPSRPRPGSASAVDSTLTALWQFDELGLNAHPAAARALAFLLAMQQPDGGWDENPDLPAYDLPPWIVRGDPGARLYLTTYAAYWLGMLGYAQHTAFKAALAYISARQTPSGQIPGYLHSNWLGIAAFLVDGGYTQNAGKGMDYLASLPFSEWDDSQIAWAIDCLTRAGLPHEHPWLAAALPELLRRQAADGSWSSDDGPAFAASATVTAIKALQRHGLVGEID